MSVCVGVRERERERERFPYDSGVAGTTNGEQVQLLRKLYLLAPPCY